MFLFFPEVWGQQVLRINSDMERMVFIPSFRYTLLDLRQRICVGWDLMMYCADDRSTSHGYRDGRHHKDGLRLSLKDALNGDALYGVEPVLVALENGR